MQDTIWRCQDGRQLLVSQMDTRHLHNSIAMIKRCGKWRRRMLLRLEVELEIRALRAYDNPLWG